jgi:dethiobiotin synthetase
MDLISGLFARAPKSDGFFVTGTDTGVGKTVITAALAGALRRRGIDCGVMKPIQTGAPRRPDGTWHAPDAEYLRTVAGVTDPMDLICPQIFAEPAAPSVAAAAENAQVDIAAVRTAYHELAQRHRAVLVEGAGGLAVPIRDRYTMADLAHDLGIPLIVVGRAGLGTINHTVLTVDFARSKGLSVLGVILSGMPASPSLAERTAAAEIERLTLTRVLGEFPRIAGLDTDAGQPGDSVERMAQSKIIDECFGPLLAG